ncbi:MAG: hypothetical protein J2P20_08245 [Pseudonocardia sp.]|nr:hypothetical protein [Pseudonocardia sp.]MBO0874586.1 hypothetical protein [Pseudonocardia sp.]
MTRASDAARNTGDADRPPRPRRPDTAAGDRPGNGSGGSGPSKSSSGKSGSSGQPDSQSGGSIARQAPQQPPRGRQPLPGPPPGARMPGPPMMGGPRYAPLPPPRRQLSTGQRAKLALLTVALIGIGAVLGSVVALVMPTQYAAQTTIQYNIAGENTGDFLKTDRNLTTQLVLITSRNVLQPVADANGVSVDDLTRRVSAAILNSSNVIQVQVKDPNREAGVNLANAIAKQYLTVANSSGPQGYLQSQLNEVRRELAAPKPGTTTAETQALNARAATLQAQLDQMNVTANQSTVLTPAYSVTDPVSPNRGLAGITGGVCGLLIALMTGVTLSRRWTRS